MINVVFIIERTPKFFFYVWKLLVYSSIKISRNLCWQKGATNSCFKALLEISPRTIRHYNFLL